MIDQNKKYPMTEAAKLMGMTYRSLYGRVLRRAIPVEHHPGQNRRILGKTILDFQSGLLTPVTREAEIIEIEGIQYRRLTHDERTKITIRLPKYEIEGLDKIASARKTHRNKIIEGAVSAFLGRYSRG